MRAEEALRATPPVQSLPSRLLWFAVGGLISVAINYAVYFVAYHQLGWTRSVALALSLALVVTLFAVWNYFVNFRTARRFHESTARYLAVIALSYALNYAIALTGMTHFGKTKALEFAILAGVQVLVSGLKFVLYHAWVYPRHS
ncbi:MAG TPA: GtrA family protein [Chthoniobacterales bacterium]